ncbi:hypothetical protein HDV05_002908, partial [Chytridiales sp. JEL 0842]
MYDRLCQLEWFRYDFLYDTDEWYVKHPAVQIPMRHCWLEYLGNPSQHPDERYHWEKASLGGQLQYAIHLEDIGWCGEYFWWDSLAEEVAEQGRSEDIEYMLQHQEWYITSKTTDHAAASGNRQLFDLLYSHTGCTGGAIKYAAASGDLILLIHLHQNLGVRPLEYEMPVSSNNFEVIKYMHENFHDVACQAMVTTYPSILPTAMDWAASLGNLEAVRFLHEHCDKGCTTYAMDLAAGAGHLPVVQFLHEQRSEGCTVKAMHDAAIHGELDVVEWLHKNREEGCQKTTISD